jgi:NAD-dependent deacetylase
VFLSVGTSSIVYPAAAFLERARSRGAYTVEINTESTPATGAVDLVLTGPADEILARVDQRLEPIRST